MIVHERGGAYALGYCVLRTWLRGGKNDVYLFVLIRTFLRESSLALNFMDLLAECHGMKTWKLNIGFGGTEFRRQLRQLFLRVLTDSCPCPSP